MVMRFPNCYNLEASGSVYELSRIAFMIGIIALCSAKPQAFSSYDPKQSATGGKGDMYTAIRAAKQQLWRDIMHLWCTYRWLLDRVEMIQQSFNQADQLTTQDWWLRWRVANVNLSFEIHLFSRNLDTYALGAIRQDRDGWVEEHNQMTVRRLTPEIRISQGWSSKSCSFHRRITAWKHAISGFDAWLLWIGKRRMRMSWRTA